VRERRLVAERTLEERLQRLRTGAPLRLAFTGRLAAIKGADHLPRVARSLRRLGVDFTLDVCGSGPLEGRIRALASRWELQPAVRLRGVLDFETELLDFVSREVDLFVCCHRQGDPSCTYLETMACGVPIAGYANEAFARLAAHARTGWTAPLDDPDALARRIAALDRDRAELERGARRARAFAAQHLFEATMDRRVEHLLDAAAAAERRAS
jgi:glycosyltransferase involved in cell wall biosynthesis